MNAVKEKKEKPLIKHDKMRTIEAYHNQNGLCYYCKQRCILFNTDIRPFPHNAATLEHIYPRTDIRRMLKEGQSAVVMACNRCNHRKSIHSSITRNNRRYGLALLSKPTLLIDLYNGMYNGRLIV